MISSYLATMTVERYAALILHCEREYMPDWFELGDIHREWLATRGHIYCIFDEHKTNLEDREWRKWHRLSISTSTKHMQKWLTDCKHWRVWGSESNCEKTISDRSWWKWEQTDSCIEPHASLGKNGFRYTRGGLGLILLKSSDPIIYTEWITKPRYYVVHDDQ